MKVKIPNYVNWFGPFHLLKPLEKFLMFLGKTEDDAYEVVSSIANKIPQKPFEILHKVRQNLPWNKRVVKIDPWDTWDMYTTLAYIALPMLKQLKGSKHGVPHDFSIVGGESWDPQLSFDWYAEDTDKLFDQHAERRWNEVMDKMIWSFEQVLAEGEGDDRDPDYFIPMTEEESNAAHNDPNSVYYQLDIKPTYKVDKDRMYAYHEKLDEGFQLFGKYYQSLWD